MKTIEQLEKDLDDAYSGIVGIDIASARLARGQIWWETVKPAIDRLKAAKADCDYGEFEELGVKIGTVINILEIVELRYN